MTKITNKYGTLQDDDDDEVDEVKHIKNED